MQSKQCALFLIKRKVEIFGGDVTQLHHLNLFYDKQLHFSVGSDGGSLRPLTAIKYCITVHSHAQSHLLAPAQIKMRVNLFTCTFEPV